MFFVVPPVVLGVQLALGDTITDQRRRLAMMAVATVAVAAGCSALPIVPYWPLELGYGGIIGDFAYSVVASIAAELVPGAGGTVSLPRRIGRQHTPQQQNRERDAPLAQGHGLFEGHHRQAPTARAR